MSAAFGGGGSATRSDQSSVPFPSLEDCESATINTVPENGNCLFDSFLGAARDLRIDLMIPQFNAAGLRSVLKKFLVENGEQKDFCSLSIFDQPPEFTELISPAKIIGRRLSELEAGYADWSGYIDFMGRDGAYGGDLEIAALSARFQVCICVYVPSSVQGPPVRHFFHPHPRCQSKKTITLINKNGQAHYGWLSFSVASSRIPLKFLLNTGTRKKYTFDSPTRTWNGNLWGTQKKGGGPDMASLSNFCAYLRPNCGDSYEIQWESGNPGRIVWNGVCWRLVVPKSEVQEVQEALRSIILQPKKYIQEATRKEAELKSLLYQVIYTNVLYPIERSSFKQRKASSGPGGEAEDEDNTKSLDALRRNLNDFPIIVDLLTKIMREYKVRPGIGYSNSDDKHLGEFVDMLLKIIGAEEVLEKHKSDLLESFFKLFFSKSQIAEEPAKIVDAINFHKQPNFKCKQPWNDGLMRRDKPDDGLVPNTPFCLWTALHLAMIDAGVPEMSGEMDRQKIKEQCLGFMLSDERDKTAKFKKEFEKMRFNFCNESGIIMKEVGVSDYYDDRKKEESWATPFEVYLAARKFNCIIHLFHKEDGVKEEEHYCFQPDYPKSNHHHQIPDSIAPPNIFLASKRQRNKLEKKFWFLWSEVRPKISRASNLFTALQSWLKQEDVRPITYDQLGKDEAEFKRKCSDIYEKACRDKNFQNDVSTPTEFILRYLACRFQVSVQICRQNPIFKCSDEMPEIDMSAGDKRYDSDPLDDNVDSDSGSDWQLLGPLPKEIDPASPALHLYWDTAYGEFVRCCSLQKRKKEEGLGDPTNSLKRLFCYPHGFERFYRVLEISAKSKKEHTLARQKAMKTRVFRFFVQSIPEKDRVPAHNVFFNDQEKTIRMQLGVIDKNGESLKLNPLETLYMWLDSHCSTTCDYHCHGFRRIQNFLNKEAGSFDQMCAFMKLICVFRHFSVFNFSDQKALSNLDKEMIFFIEDKKDYRKIGEIDEADIYKDHFILCRDLDSCVCIFEGRGSKSMCDLACSDLNFANAGWPMSLKQFVAMQKHSSSMTARWLRHDSGHTLKVWAHMPKHEYEKCETEKCKNRGQKWRHMIYSYAVMALLWNEFNGNKEGPLGHYPSRSAQKMALGGSPSSDPGDSRMQVYASKKGGFPVDYVGHNVVALAVGKRGDILRIAYNHNTLFSSTVDHAEERLIDGLYREPTNLVQRSHAKIYDGETLAKVEIEKHMQHISVYTSLEPCQQCSGKMLLALVPEVISCQRDWDIRLLGDQLYNQFHKCRAVLASHFDFSPYDDLGRSYSIYRERVIRNKMSFFKSDYHHVPAKPTMPYFLCTDEAHAIFKRGHDVFGKVLYILFNDQSSRPTFDDDDLPCQFFKTLNPERKPRSTVCAQDKIDLLQLLNIDVSDWLDDFNKIAMDIRNFRPSLSDKKNRLFHDELLHLRRSWVSNVFKQMCTLTFFCDPNCTIDESTIETKLSPLGDITSINLIRTVEGLLKGIFAVTFASYETAKNVKESLEKIVFRPASNKWKDVEADFPPGFRVNSVGKRKEYIDASEWLHQIRAPLAFELFLPNCPNDSDNPSIPDDFKSYFTKTKSKTMFRKWPLRHQTEGKLCDMEAQVLHIKCRNSTDIASARRLKCKLPNFDEPNNIRVTFLPTTGDGSGVSGTRVYFSRVTSPTNVHAGTFTLIARTDVTEGQMLNYINECFPQHNCSPFSLGFFCNTLTSCNSSQTLKWIDVTSVSMRCFDWKVWSFPFVCKIGSVGAADHIDPKFSILCQMQPTFTSQKLPRRYFCQPYPQSVLDFDVYVPDQCYKLRSILLHPEQFAEPQRELPALQNPQNLPNLKHKFLFNITKVSRANEQDKAAKEVSILFLLDCERQSCEIVTDAEANTERSKYVTIDICESSLVTLISSYMLIESKQDVKALLVFVVTEKGGKYFDFWGKEFQISIAASKDKAAQDKKAPKLVDIVDVDEIIDSLLFIRRNNLLSLLLHIDSANFLHLTFPETRPEGHSSFFCEFCGVYTDFPVLGKGGKILKVCCAAHTKGNDPSKSSVPKMEKLKVGHYKIKNLWKKASEVENELYESHVDPARDTHPRRLIENIRQTEKDLQLEFCVSNKSYRASRNGNNHIGSVSFLLRRDDVFGPAHILFCMYSPFEMNESIRFQIAVSGKPLVTSDFGVEDIHVIKRVETVNRSKKTNAGRGKKVYGRLKDKEQGKQVKHQGGEIPADSLRKFLEPEYFPELFAFDDEHDSFPFYPTLEFLGPSKCDGATVVNSASSGGGDDGGAGDGDGGGNDDACKSGDVAIVSLHSWDFLELQTPELSRLLVCQKQLHAVEFDRLKKLAEICEKKEKMLELAKSQSAPRRDSSSVYKSTVWTKHEYFKEYIQFQYVDSAQAGSVKKLTIPSRFRGQLFPSTAWARLVSDESIDNPDQFLTLLDDLVLSNESRQNIADFLPKWASQKFSLGSLIGFLDESGLHWSKYEYLKASIAEKTKISDSQRDEEEVEVLHAFLDLISNGNSKAGDSSKALSDESKSTIKKYLTLTINDAGTPIFEDLPKIIDVLVSELNLHWDNPNLKCTQLMMEKYFTAKKTVAEKNAIVQKTIVEALKKSMQQHPESEVNDAAQAEHLLRSFMQLMDINDHNFDPKERIMQGVRLRNQLGDQDGTSNLHKVVEITEVSLAANIQKEKELAANVQKEKEEKRPDGVENVKNAEKERANFFNKADPIIQAQKSAENFEIANANSVAAFLRLIGYPALSKVSADYKKAIRDSFNKSANIVPSSLLKEHPPSCLHLQKIQGYFLNVVPSVFGRKEIEDAFGGKTLDFKALDLARNPLRDGLQNFRDCLSKGTLEQTLEIIWKQVETHFRDSSSDVVEVHDAHNQSKFGISKELERLRDCLKHQSQKIPTLTGDYDRAFSACVSLFQNEPTTAERTAAAESSIVDVAFLIVGPESSECREPSKTKVKSDANSVLDAFRTISGQKDQNLVFWYDGGVVSGESTLRDIGYEPSKTIYVTAAKGGEVKRAAAPATAAVAAGTPAPPQQKKLTRKTLQAMTSREVAEEATRRSSCFFADHTETCITALQSSAVSGATYQSDWTRASLEAKLVPYFFDESIRLYLRSVVDALLAMKAEADSGKEYSKMLETFIFFLQHEPANMQCQMGLEANSDLPTSSSSSSAASSPTPPAAVSHDVDTRADADAEGGTALAPAAPHAIAGGAAGGGENVKVKTAGGSGGGDAGDGGGGKSIFEKFLNEFKDGCDPVEWILETGKELERTCNFALALKYYFAGRMFFARLKKHPQLRKCLQAQEQWKTRLKYEKKFDELYSDLLPMTNAEAYEKARESVHAQKVIQGRGTMNK